MRIAVVGTTGSGETTLAKALAAHLDALNWQAGWRDLSRTDPNEFARRVTRAIADDAWAIDGAYGLVRDLVWHRATHLGQTDYAHLVVLRRRRPGDTDELLHRLRKTGGPIALTGFRAAS